MLLGVGNELQADDGAGLLAVRAIKTRLGNSPDMLLIEGATAPENFTGPIRRFAPDLVIIIDAAKMGKKVGEIDWIDLEQIDGFSASSHVQPLSILAGYLIREMNCEVMALGIEAGILEFGEPVSKEVDRSIIDIVDGFVEALSVS